MFRNVKIATYIAVMLASIWASTSPAGAEPIKIASDPWKPWVLGEDGKPATGGWAVEVAENLFARLGLETETIIYPYERCLMQMKTGERDVLLMAKKTPEREQYMVFSDVAATDSQYLYFNPAHMKDFGWNTMADLRPYVIGGVSGFNYGDLSTAAKDGSVRLDLVATDDQNIQKLFSGRIDLIAANESTINDYLRHNPQDAGKLKRADTPLSLGEFRFGISKKGHAVGYVDKINQALADMRADGTMDRIFGPPQ